MLSCTDIVLDLSLTIENIDDFQKNFRFLEGETVFSGIEGFKVKKPGF